MHKNLDITLKIFVKQEKSHLINKLCYSYQSIAMVMHKDLREIHI